MIRHPGAYTELLLPEDVDRILETSLRILEEVGLVIHSEEACSVLADAGCHVDEEQRVRFPHDLCRNSIEQTPARWTLHARNPDNNVEMGSPHAYVSPGYGSAFVADAGGRRRDATIEDFRKIALLAYQSEAVDITGGLLVEPADVPPDQRPVELTRALLICSDKPFLGSVTGAEGARQSLEVARIALGDISEKPSVIGLININSPLRLDARMAEAMLEYAKAGQPILLTPGILMGVTAPVTVAGALAQAFAELIGCVTLAQLIRAGAPVIVGTGGFGADLRVGGSGFGRPEQGLSTIMAAQLARSLEIPYRCSAGVTGAFSPDARAGYESMMTAICGWTCGSHLCLQAAGTLDLINTMSYEKLAIDLEIWGYLKRLATTPKVDEESLAFEAIASLPRDYLSLDHTLAHFRGENYDPTLAPPDTYEAWEASGLNDVVAHATARVEQMLADLTPPPMDQDIKRELDAYPGRVGG